MKYLAAVLAFTLSTALTQAQPAKDRGSRPEIPLAQQAEIHTKRLALAIDLNAGQMKQIMDLEKDHLEQRRLVKEEVRQWQETSTAEGQAEAPRKEKNRRGPGLSPELQIKMLNLQLAHQEGMKKILNEEQYQQWKEMQHHKKRVHHKRGRKGHNSQKGH